MLLIMPDLRREGALWKLMMGGVCLSVRLSHASRTERRRKPQNGKMEVHHTINPWTYLEVKRSKDKVTRPINAVTDNGLANTPNEVKRDGCSI